MRRRLEKYVSGKNPSSVRHFRSKNTHRAQIGILTSAATKLRITTVDHSPHHQNDLLLSGAGLSLTPFVSLPRVNALRVQVLPNFPPCAFLLLAEPPDTQHNMYDLRPKLDTQRSGSKVQPQLSILNVQPPAWLTLACCSPLCGRLCCLSFNQTSSRRSFVGFFPWQKS